MLNPGVVGGSSNSDPFPAGLRVLVVDDDPTCLMILERMLRTCLYRVTKCNRAEIALTLLRKNKNGFDIVISDVHMPDMNGFKLLEHVGLEMDLPVIMMSADDSKSVVLKGVTHGAVDYLIKPVRIEALKNIWQHVVRKKRNVSEHSGSVEETGGDRQQQQRDDGDDGGGDNNSSSGNNEGNLRRRKEEEQGDDKEDTSSLKKPRVVWSVELHQQFVAAVNHLGVDKAVPKKILEMMNVQGLTRENVASHLQKYRIYLKRLGGVSQHQGSMNHSFMTGQDPSYGPLNGFDLQSLAAAGQLPAQSLAQLQAAGLGWSSSSLIKPGTTSVDQRSIFTFQSSKFGDGHGQMMMNGGSGNKQMSLLHGVPTGHMRLSYSNTSSDYNTGDETTASDMVVFLLRWFDKFPELKSRDFFLTGESYAGHYIPQLADAILSYNIHSTGYKFNVKGIAIGNPLLELGRDTSATYEFIWSHGMISDETRGTITTHCDFSNLHNLSQVCSDALKEADTINGYVNNYDVLLDVCYPSIVQQELKLKQMATKISMGVDVCMTYERKFYFNLPEVQQALHANRTRLPYQWSMCSSLVNYRDTDASINMLPILKRIIQNKTPVWIFSGDQDAVVPLLGSRTLVRELAHHLNFKTTLPYRPWFHKNQVGGWVTEYGKLLTFATVRGAAHMVPYAQPSRALHMFSSFVHGRRLHNNTHYSPDE